MPRLRQITNLCSSIELFCLHYRIGPSPPLSLLTEDTAETMRAHLLVKDLALATLISKFNLKPISQPLQNNKKRCSRALEFAVWIVVSSPLEEQIIDARVFNSSLRPGHERSVVGKSPARVTRGNEQA